jgi:hypothetical protein
LICLATAGGLGYLAYSKATKGLEDAK